MNDRWMTLDEVVDELVRLHDALKECEVEIDNYIDAERPLGVHPKWDADNAMYKAQNPARIALEAKG